ncbi:MAG: hypothetical protein E4G94_09065 [ANME-2 cluster archaeon]|nr:MAG: hypothetical protein E4G94_09065 [ANME-2 cluster archaeon]
MRVRKQRAFYRGEMIYNVQRLGNGLYWDNGKNFDLFAFQRSNPAILMDWVGITDLNGIDIYEGDYVKCVLSFKTGGIIDSTIYDLIECGFRLSSGVHFSRYENEVLGNIYQNSDIQKEVI